MQNNPSDMTSCWTTALQERPALTRWLSHWQGSLNGQRTPLQDQLPWMTYAAISWLEEFLRPEMSVFEWGSGGSSAFFAQRAKSVVSVEHDAAWFSSVVEALRQKGYTNAAVNLVEPVRGIPPSLWYTSTCPDYAQCSFERYASFIDSYPDESFDLVVVDGRSRTGCMQHAMPKVKRGGILLLDNSERIEYEAGCRLLAAWPEEKMWGPGPYNSYPWETRIWLRER